MKKFRTLEIDEALAPLVGKLVDRYPPQPIVGSGFSALAIGLTAEQAFDYLQRLSTDAGVGLLHVAEHLVETRELRPPSAWRR